MRELAAELRANPPGRLLAPQQDSYGNCWLLTALVGLQQHNPRLLLDMITLYPRFASVQLPCRPPMHIDYLIPPNLVRIREAADLYYALICKALCVVLHREGGACLYGACHGGKVSIALSMLCPTHPPLVFCETLRDNAWHSLLLLRPLGSHLICYDPHHGRIMVAAQSCNLVLYSSCSSGAPSTCRCGSRSPCRILDTGRSYPS
jgi:hypothetical protein